MSNILDYGYKAVDSDLGEMFLNFPLDSSIQLSSGIDLAPYKRYLEITHPELRTKGYFLITVWNRIWMGYRPSPYAALRTFYHAEEFIIGDTNSPSNPFRWDDITLNLPGGEFNPTKARVVKWDVINERVDTDMLIYMDDLRVVSQTLELTWVATGRF